MRVYILVIAILALSACGNSKVEEQVSASGQPEQDVLTLTEVQLKSTAIEIGKIEEKSISSIIKVSISNLDFPII